MVILYDYKKSGWYIYNTIKEDRKAYRNYNTIKDTKTFRQHIALVKSIWLNSSIDNNLDAPTIIKININIANLNQKYDTNIEYFNNPISLEWINECRIWFKMVNYKVKQELANNDYKNIQE